MDRVSEKRWSDRTELLNSPQKGSSLCRKQGLEELILKGRKPVLVGLPKHFGLDKDL